MASLALAASAAKRRLPILMSVYSRVPSSTSTCYFERRKREIEKEGENLGKMKKIYGPPPEDLEIHLSHGGPRFRPGSVIPAPCISETKCYDESAPQIKSVSQPLAADATDFSPKLNLNANAHPDILIHSYDKDSHPYFRAYSVDEKDGSMSPKYYMYPPSPIKEHGIFLGATCNGLFHFMDDDDSGHFLWNPATQEIKILPKSSVPAPRLVVYRMDSVMWFDHARQDYKLLQLVSTYPVDDQGDYTDPCFWIWWYSLQSNSWKKLPCTNVSFYTPVSACIDGVYYSAARLIDPDGAQAIMAFNLSTETLYMENLPSIAIDGYFLYWILEYKGLLSILVYPCTGYEPTKYELWVRKDEVWTRESVLHVSGVRYPTWFSKNGRLLYFESFKDEVVVFDRATGKSKNLGIHSHSKQLRFYPFAENFVQLNGVSVDEEQGKEEGEEDDYGYMMDGPLMT
ncbi:hypothetical protein OROHE_024323 [Orobanche hederae]